jgi:hypothetical protein
MLCQIISGYERRQACLADEMQTGFDIVQLVDIDIGIEWLIARGAFEALLRELVALGLREFGSLVAALICSLVTAYVRMNRYR